MANKKIRALAPIIIGCALILYGALIPQQPKSAWWCTAFSIVCKEAVDETPDNDGAGLELHWLIKDIADKLADRGKR